MVPHVGVTDVTGESLSGFSVDEKASGQSKTVQRLHNINLVFFLIQWNYAIVRCKARAILIEA